MRPRSLSAWFQPGASQLGRVRLSVLAALSASSLSARAIAATPAETAPVVSAAGSLFQVVIGLVAVLLLIAAAAWLAKRLGVSQVGTSSLLRVVSTAAVGTRERVVVVEVGESWLVVGVAPLPAPRGAAVARPIP